MDSNIFRKLKTLTAVTGLAIVASACGEVAGVDDGMGEVQVTLQEATAEALFNVVAAEFANAPETTAGRVPRGEVELLTVTVTGIQILPYCEDAGEQSGDGQCEDLWVPLDLDGEYELDLLTLPSEGSTAFEITAVTAVPEGVYHKIRLFISEAKVAFENTITVGHSTFAAFNTDDGFDPLVPTTWVTHDVEIPSAQNSGIKADIDIEVVGTEVTDIGLLFDADATFRNVIATGNGRVLMPPVLKARPMNQNQNQNQNQGS